MPEQVRSPFQTEASIGALKPKTTIVGSAKLRNWSEEIKKHALFSARTTRKTYLEDLKKKLIEVAGRDVTPEMAAFKLKATLAQMGYNPATGFPGDASKWHGVQIPPAAKGSITDLSSSRRINLIIDTNIKQAQAMGQLVASENPVQLMLNPAWELTRVGSRKQPRSDWKERWKRAGDSVNWKGALKKRFWALKDSPIWMALGKGEGGFHDTLGSDYPPYAFGSGMGWVNVKRSDWQKACKSEGVPDQLESIVEKAKALKRAQEAVGGKGAYGESAVEKPEKGWLEEAKKVDVPPPPIFHPDTSKLDEVKEACEEFKKEAEARRGKYDFAEDDILSFKSEVKALITDYPDVDLSVIEMNLNRLLLKVKVDVSMYVAAANEKINKAQAVLTPTDEESQEKYNLQMEEIKDSLKVLQDTEFMSVDADTFVDEARKLVDEAKKTVDTWLKLQCEALVTKAKGLIGALLTDEFEEIKNEFVEAKKKAKAEGRL